MGYPRSRVRRPFIPRYRGEGSARRLGASATSSLSLLRRNCAEVRERRRAVLPALAPPPFLAADWRLRNETACARAAFGDLAAGLSLLKDRQRALTARLARSRTNRVQLACSALCFNHEVENARSQQPPPDQRAGSGAAPVPYRQMATLAALDLRVRGHDNVGRYSRPEKSSQALEKAQNGLGHDVARSLQPEAAARCPRQRPRQPDTASPQCERLGRCDRPENRSQGLGNTESAPGISRDRPSKLSGPRPGRRGSNSAPMSGRAFTVARKISRKVLETLNPRPDFGRSTVGGGHAVDAGLARLAGPSGPA